MNTDKTMSIRAFAQLADIELGWAYRLCWAGTVEAEKIGGKWRVSESSALAYARKRKAKRERANEKLRRKQETARVTPKTISRSPCLLRPSSRRSSQRRLSAIQRNRDEQDRGLPGP